jgi:hypothetical protein
MENNNTENLYKQLIKTFENICDNLYYNIEYFEKFNKDNIDYIDKPVNNYNDTFAYKIDKNGYCFAYYEDEIINKKITIKRFADVLIGFQMEKDCYIDISFGGSKVYKKIKCKKNEIVYFDDPIFILSIPYNNVIIYINEETLENKTNNFDNMKIKMIYVYLLAQRLDDRRFLAQNQLELSNCFYVNGMCCEKSNTTIDFINNSKKKFYDLTSINPNNSSIGEKRIMERTNLYYKELIEKTCMTFTA